MENQTRPNLFTYATSELSQDAFICWLAAWADLKFNDSELHQIASEFLVSLIQKHKKDYTLENIQTVKVRRQVEKLDILIEINKESLNDKLAILIEDKTHTSNHSDQLNRYYGKIKEYGYDESQMISVYFKTGYQSKFDALGIFKPYLRSDFLKVLRGESKNIKNAIYHDFLYHLEEMDSMIKQFSAKDLKDWEDKDWIGFFIVLYENIHKLYKPFEEDQVNWNYVANPTGGFYGFWWYFKPLQDQLYTPYLQLENNSLCFKIEVHNETERSVTREEVYRKLVETANKLGITPVKRPERMGSGRCMTILRWNGDYRAHNNGLLDFDNTLENLKKAQQILDTAFPK